MKNGVQTKADFKVDSVNKVVVCTMKVDMKLDKIQSWAVIRKEWWGKQAPMVDDFGYFTVIAKARCNSTDTFDETLGKRIAESRAKAKAFKISARVYKCIKKHLEDMVAEANNKAKACEYEMGVELNHISKLVK